MNEPEYITAPEALRYLEERKMISKNTFYKCIKNGEIPHIKLGRKIFLRKDFLKQIADLTALKIQAENQKKPRY